MSRTRVERAPGHDPGRALGSVQRPSAASPSTDPDHRGERQPQDRAGHPQQRFVRKNLDGTVTVTVAVTVAVTATVTATAAAMLPNLPLDEFVLATYSDVIIIVAKDRGTGR
ncbi:hypothetical protein N0V90_012817 [Kalmusia sp. IMI 367209]|nr:hypothetical protein N0V90_012817 [Kalmusia sp. IMI 367209]